MHVGGGAAGGVGGGTDVLVAVLVALGLAGAAFTGRLKLYTAVLERATTRKYQALLVCSKKKALKITAIYGLVHLKSIHVD